jgi:hypothetical protein
MGNTQNDGWLPKQYNVSPYFPNNIDWSGVAQTACGNYDSVGYGMSSNYSQGLNCPCWWYGSPP